MLPLVCNKSDTRTRVCIGVLKITGPSLCRAAAATEPSCVGPLKIKSFMCVAVSSNWCTACNPQLLLQLRAHEGSRRVRRAETRLKTY